MSEQSTTESGTPRGAAFGPPFWLIAFGLMATLYHTSTFFAGQRAGALAMEKASVYQPGTAQFASAQDFLFNMRHLPLGESRVTVSWDMLLLLDCGVGLLGAAALVLFGFFARSRTIEAQQLLCWIGTVILAGGTAYRITIATPLTSLMLDLNNSAEPTARRLGADWVIGVGPKMYFIVIGLELLFAFSLGVIGSWSGRR